MKFNPITSTIIIIILAIILGTLVSITIPNVYLRWSMYIVNGMVLSRIHDKITK